MYYYYHHHILLCIDISSTSTSYYNRYICDPVLGDNGKYYVPPAMINIFIEKLIPRFVSLLFLCLVIRNLTQFRKLTLLCIRKLTPHRLTFMFCWL